ncbi:MAG: glycosyltransferase [Gaiellaceae bacterium]
MRPHCDIVVSHAGSGTVPATLSLGLPQLCVPQGADQFLNAAAVASAGAGISLMPDQVQPEDVRQGVVRLLDEASFREAAGRVRRSISSMPSPNDAASMILLV